MFRKDGRAARKARLAMTDSAVLMTDPNPLDPSSPSNETIPMQSGQSQKLGEVLVAQGRITREDLASAWRECEQSGRALADVLAAQGLVPKDESLPLLAKDLGVQFVRLKDLSVSPQVLNKVPARLASRYSLVPLGLEGKRLQVAVANPLDMHALDDVRLLLGCEVQPVLAEEEEIREAIEDWYGLGAGTIEEMSQREDAPRVEADVSGDNLEDMVENASVVRFVNQIFLQAYKERATDIHMEPYENELRIRFRIDGVLHETAVPPEVRHFQSAIASRIKIMANLNIAERRLPQDGRTQVRVGGEELDLRISTLPTPCGESLVIRVLSRVMLYDLAHLGFSERDLGIIEELIVKPHGILFVTGPTGSGKSTTLYACLSKINTQDKKIVTIEDPIEYQLRGISQVQVQPQIGLSFAHTLRAMLRHDPDVMMVGEVRDLETAEIAIRVALTGHLVFSTLHTNSAAGAVTRLLDMGLEPYLVSSSVQAFMAQRLVRLICEHCREPHTVSQEEASRYGMPEIAGSSVFRGKGCAECRNTGYRGRTGIYEILPVTESIRRLIMDHVPADRIAQEARSAGCPSLRDEGLAKVRQGLTSLEEIQRVSQIEDI
ncbi:MAG: Flp pilus assembly complex ATPase component TadA [Candidatus Omnitrophica bacterium]|nr:Flp pilus assembly complex ATPase component TadA [Candidatus Omnitrophota bacterium]